MIAQIATTPQRGGVKDTPDALVGRLSRARGACLALGWLVEIPRCADEYAGAGAKRVPFTACFPCARELLFLLLTNCAQRERANCVFRSDWANF